MYFTCNCLQYVSRETYLSLRVCCGTLFHMEQAKITEFVQNYTPWRHEDHMLVSMWSFDSFEQVQKYVGVLCDLASELNHHPNITFGYNFIRIETTTHDAGNAVTEKDFKLAKRVCELLPKSA